MLRSFVIWETGLAVALALVIGERLRSLVVARRRGFTRNVSRLVTFSALLLLTAVYCGVSLSWLRFADAADPLSALRSLPTVNWGYLVLGVMITLILAFEAASHVHALRAGLTSNVSRLAILAVALLIVLVLLGMSGAKWEFYLDQLQAVYSDSLQPPG